MFNLPAPRPYRLARPPLVQALAQIQFPLQARFGTLDGVAVVQEALAAAYPYLSQQQVQNLEVEFGPDGPQAQVGGAQSEFVFSSDDGHSIVITPTAATLSTGADYQGSEDFAQRFSTMVATVSDVARLPRIDRLGVRYLNLTEIPLADTATWTTWYRPEIVGIAGSQLLDEASRMHLSIAQSHAVTGPIGDMVEFPAQVEALMRYGLAPGGSAIPGIPPLQLPNAAYIIDTDIFVVAPQNPDPAVLTGQVQTLQSQIDRFFRWCLTPAGEEFFGLEELA